MQDRGDQDRFFVNQAVQDAIAAKRDQLPVLGLHAGHKRTQLRIITQLAREGEDFVHDGGGSSLGILAGDVLPVAFELIERRG